MKVLIFDSGPLINLSMNGLLFILEDMKKCSECRFIITDAVRKEVIDKPLNIQRYELGAIRIQDLLEKKVLEMPSAIGISPDKIREQTEKLMDSANHAVRLNSQSIRIVSDAEISCIALSNELNRQKIDNLIAVDERTTRILAESPENLERIMSGKLNHQIKVDVRNLKDFQNHKFIRSSELVYVAYKKGLIKLYGKRVLEALVFATKFKGSSISYDELNELKKM